MPDWQNLEFWEYLTYGGAGVVVLAIILYFLPLSKIKLPAIIFSSLGCLALGGGLGMLLMASLGYHWNKEGPPSASAPGSGQAMGGGPGGLQPPGNGAPGRGGPGGGMPMPGGGGPGGGRRGPTSKAQLASLVSKLAVLTGKPLAVNLTPEQRTKIREQLEGLDTKEELSDEDAKKRLDAVLEVVKSQRETMEAAGYSWPTEGGAPGGFPGGPGGGRGGGNTPPNPFKEGDNEKNLKALRAQVGDKAGT